MVFQHRLLLTVFLLGGLTFATCNSAKGAEKPKSDKLLKEIEVVLFNNKQLNEIAAGQKLLLSCEVTAENTLKVIESIGNNQKVLEFVSETLAGTTFKHTKGLTGSKIMLKVLIK